MVLWEKRCHGALGEEAYVMVLVLWRRDAMGALGESYVMVLGGEEVSCALGEEVSWRFGRSDVMVLWEK